MTLVMALVYPGLVVRLNAAKQVPKQPLDLVATDAR